MHGEVRIPKRELVEARGSLEMEMRLSGRLKDIPKHAFVERIDYFGSNEVVFKWEACDEH